jgi:DNA polymerase zeta
MSTSTPLHPSAPSGSRLVDTVVSPHALVESGGGLRLNGQYYITKQIIPALERVLSLVRHAGGSWVSRRYVL